MTIMCLAALGVAGSGLSAAPPSFDGQGWLFVINLTFFTAGFYLMLMFSAWQVSHIWRNRGHDELRHPVTVWRLTGLLIAIGLCLRCGAEALNLWAWEPANPAQMEWALSIKRFVDPIAAMLGFGGLALFSLSARGVVFQLPGDRSRSTCGHRSRCSNVPAL